MMITVFTHKEDVPGYKQILEGMAFGTTALEYKIYETYDDFIEGFPQDRSFAVIVARKGADGMECARNAKLIQPSIPLIWFSNDSGFGVESYRIGCSFFSAEKVTEELIYTALRKCD